jgi:hypothetical protein
MAQYTFINLSALASRVAKKAMALSGGRVAETVSAAVHTAIEAVCRFKPTFLNVACKVAKPVLEFPWLAALLTLECCVAILAIKQAVGGVARSIANAVGNGSNRAA